MPGPLTDKQKEAMAEGRKKAAEKRAADAQRRAERKTKSRERSPQGRTQVWPAGLTRQDVVELIEAAVLSVDATVASLNPQAWGAGDRLNGREANMLAVQISKEVERSPAALRGIAAMSKYGQRAGLIGVLLVIAAPRLRNRGAIPDFLVPMIRKLAGPGDERDGEPVYRQPSEPSPVEREREDDLGQPDYVTPEVARMRGMPTPEATEASDLRAAG